MNRAKLKEINDAFLKEELRLKSLKKGDKIYELDLQDPIGYSYFEHEVVSVDLDEMIVNTLDKSQEAFYPGGKPSRLSGFYLPSELK